MIRVLLHFFLLMGFASAAIGQPQLSLRAIGETGVSMEDGLTPVAIYRESDPEISGLRRAHSVAVSSDLLFVTAFGALSIWRQNQGLLDQISVSTESRILSRAEDVAVSGELLFVAAPGGNYLSVWRVDPNAGNAVLSESHFDGLSADGLSSVSNVVVHGDLLFATARGDHALSVWRINNGAGTLRQIALYRDEDGNDDPDIGVNENAVAGEYDGLEQAYGIAQSANLLFVTAREDDALSVWRFNPLSGTLTQTALYQDEDGNDQPEIGVNENLVTREYDGLAGAESVAVSANLLFVTALEDSALSVWRINPLSGTLMRTALYRAEDISLREALDVTVSGDLLFVAANGALSVWRINVAAGILTQTALYQNNTDGIDGLAQAQGIAVSGDLLFVTAGGDNALSVWQTGLMQVSAGLPVQVAVQTDGPVAMGVTVTVTARQGTRTVPAEAIVFSVGSTSAEVVFPADSFDPGRWVFTAEASSPAALLAQSARTAMQVLPPPVLTLQGLPEVLASQPVQLALRSAMPVAVMTRVTLIARREQNMLPGPDMLFGPELILSPSVLSATAVFPGGNLSPGEWIITAQAEPAVALNVETARVTVQVLPPPALTLLTERNVLAGFPVQVTLQLDKPLEVTTTVTLRLMPPGSLPSFIVGAVLTLSPGISSTITEVIFPVERVIFTADPWLIIAEAVPAAALDAEDIVPLLVSSQPVLTLQAVLETPFGLPVPVALELDKPLEVTATVTLSAVRSSPLETVSLDGLVLRPGASSATAVFLESALGLGAWTITARVEPAAALNVEAASINVQVSLPPVLTLQGLPETPFGLPVPVALELDRPLAVMATVTLSAVRSTPEAEVSLDGLALRPGASSATAVFSESVLGPGVWTITARAEPAAALNVETANVTVQVSPSPVLTLQAEPERPFGLPVPVALELDKPLEVTATVTLSAARSSPEAEVSLDGLLLRPGASSATAVFLESVLGPGVWTITARAEPAAALNVETANTTVQVSPPPVLTLQAESETPFGLPVPVALELDKPLEVTATVTLSAVRGSPEETVSLDGLLLRPGALSATAVFSESVLGPGAWTITARAEPAAALNVENASATVQVSPPPVLTLQAEPEIPFGLPVPVALELDKPLEVTATVTLSAVRSSPEAEVSLDGLLLRPGVSSATAVFLESVLGTGTWTITARAEPAAALNVENASATVQVSPPPVQFRLEVAGSSLPAGSTLLLTVRTDTAPSTSIRYDIMAVNTDVLTIPAARIGVIYPAGSTEYRVSFPGRFLSYPGRWQFSIVPPPDSSFSAGPTVPLWINLDYMRQGGGGVINADDLVFALRYLVLCGGTAAGCPERTPQDLAVNLSGMAPRISVLPAALSLPAIVDDGQSTDVLTLLRALVDLSKEVLFPDASAEEQALRLDFVRRLIEKIPPP